MSIVGLSFLPLKGPRGNQEPKVFVMGGYNEGF